ncbi:MarR family winged helix-turn-helix transcriptional regulator [Tropicimonas sp. IMCC6043]|uniref:MarR family winged helix-turn-helix transcriptional regulator n=1 Tax=Tropicimonas sp. IMCC6043 TaxID=2510645 RepID=UPI00101B984B|nr:MarR family transcriptional regulator [Tropicimonas sp. IMCC6043]RYH09568.1 MarR family transcriptional regulator [Tropicimonas sp. IMCC6043]
MTAPFAQDSAGFLANHMARLFARALQTELKPLGLAPAQFMVLVELWETDGQTQAALSQRLAVEQATMANTLSRMERDGLVARRAHAEDARARLVWTTDRAQTLRAPALDAARRINREALAGLAPEAQAGFLAEMRQVIAALTRRS